MPSKQFAPTSQLKVKVKKNKAIQLAIYYSSIINILMLTIPILKAPLLGNGYGILMGILIFNWFFLSLLYSPSWLLRQSKTQLFVNLQVFFYFILIMFGAGNMLESSIFVIPFWYFYYVYSFYKFNNLTTHLARIVKISFIFWLLTIITTIYATWNLQYISREISGMSFRDRYAFLTQNIGGVEFAYSSVIVFSTLISVLLDKVQKTRKQLIAIYSIMTIITFFIFKASSGIVFVAYFLTLGSVPIIKSKLTYKGVFISLYVISFLLLSSSIPGYLRAIGEFTGDRYLNSKMDDLASSFEGNKTTGDLRGRENAYILSIKSIKDNIFFGVGPFYAPEDQKHGIDGHSQFLSDFARFGIIYILFFILLLKNLFTDIAIFWKTCGISSKPTLPFLTFFFLYALNPLNNVIGVTLLLFIPGVSLIILKSGSYSQKEMKNTKKLSYKNDRNEDTLAQQ